MKQILWTTFLRTNGKWSLWHLSDENGKCNCGWQYKPDEYVNKKEQEIKPDFAVCDFCQSGEKDEDVIRLATVSR